MHAEKICHQEWEIQILYRLLFNAHLSSVRRYREPEVQGCIAYCVFLISGRRIFIRPELQFIHRHWFCRSINLNWIHSSLQHMLHSPFASCTSVGHASNLNYCLLISTVTSNELIGVYLEWCRSIRLFFDSAALNLLRTGWPFSIVYSFFSFIWFWKEFFRFENYVSWFLSCLPILLSRVISPSGSEA